MFTTISANIICFVLAYIMAIGIIMFCVYLLPMIIMALLEKAKLLSDKTCDKIVNFITGKYSIVLVAFVAIFIAIYLIKTDSF